MAVLSLKGDAQLPFSVSGEKALINENIVRVSSICYVSKVLAL